MPDFYLQTHRGDDGRDVRVLRGRQSALADAADRARSRRPPAGGARQLVQVYDGGMMPTSVDHMFATHPVTLDADETEGAAWTPTADTSRTIYVDVIGKVPGVGDILIAKAVGDGRWAAERRGGTTTICLTICGGIPVAMATIQLWTTGGDSTMVASCTTTTAGCCTFTQSGSYVIKVVISGTTYTEGTKTLNGTTITIAVSAGSSVVCCGGYAIPTAMSLTDAVGTISFAYVASSSPPTWYGALDVQRLSVPITPNPTPGPFVPLCGVYGSSVGPMSVCYKMVCNAGSSPTFTVTRYWGWLYFGPGGAVVPTWFQDSPLVSSGPWPGCYVAPFGGGFSCPQNGFPPIAPFGDASTFSANPTTSSPFALSGTPVPSGFSFGTNQTADPIGGSVAIS